MSAPRPPTRPLAGRAVVVTRAADQAGSLSARLRELGAEVVEVPVIEVVPPVGGSGPLRDALASLAPGDWLALTSANGVHAVLRLLGARSLPGGVAVSAVGPATKTTVREAGIESGLVPVRAVAYGFGRLSPAVSFSKFSSRFHGHNERVDIESVRRTTEAWDQLCRDFLT